PERANYVQRLWDLVVQRFKAQDTPHERDVVDAFCQYGCRRITKFLPGYARMVKVKDDTDGPDLTGDWEKRFRVVPEKSSAEKAVEKTEYKPEEKKREEVEVCEVTHVQLEATLQNDLQLLVRQQQYRQDARDPKPPTPVGGEGKVPVAEAQLKALLGGF